MMSPWPRLWWMATRSLGIENEVVREAGQREIAHEFGAMIDRRGTRRKDFDDDPADLESVPGRPRPASHQRVGFEDVASPDPHSEPFDVDATGCAGAFEGAPQGAKDLAFVALCVTRSGAMATTAP